MRGCFEALFQLRTTGSVFPGNPLEAGRWRVHPICLGCWFNSMKRGLLWRRLLCQIYALLLFSQLFREAKKDGFSSASSVFHPQSASFRWDFKFLFLPSAPWSTSHTPPIHPPSTSHPPPILSHPMLLVVDIKVRFSSDEDENDEKMISDQNAETPPLWKTVSNVGGQMTLAQAHMAELKSVSDSHLNCDVHQLTACAHTAVCKLCPQTPPTPPISRCETRPPTMSGSKFLPEKYVLKHLYSLSSVICQLWVTAGMPRSKNQKCVVIRKYISWFCEFLLFHWSNRQQNSFDFHFAHFADWLKYLPSFLFGFLSWIWQTLRFLIWI